MEAFDVGGSHENCRELKRAHPEEWETYYKFAIVRNTWDWYASLYRYWAYMERARHFNGDRMRGKRISQNWYRSKVANFADSVDKVRFLWGVRRTRTHYWRQRQWVVDGGEIVVDDLFRLADLPEWYGDLAERFGLPEITKENAINQGRHYSAYYTDEMARTIGEFYKPDIEQFGFTFDRVEDYDPALSEVSEW